MHTAFPLIINAEKECHIPSTARPGLTSNRVEIKMIKVSQWSEKSREEELTSDTQEDS